MCEKVLLADLLSYWNGGKFADAWRAAFNGRVPKPLEGTARYEAVKTACRLTCSMTAIFECFGISHCHTPQLTLLGGTLRHTVLCRELVRLSAPRGEGRSAGATLCWP